MSGVRPRLLSCLVLLLAGCASPDAAPPGRAASRWGIVGGTPTRDDLSVFMLDIRGNNGASTRCSATLLAARTLLTAAHCVDPATLGSASLTIAASNAPTEPEMIAGVNTVRVVEARLHPNWNAAAGLGNDLALLLLEAAQAGPVSPWNRQPLSGLGGKAVRVVGYGADSPDAGTGTKRTVDLSIRQTTPELILIGNLVNKGICHGDSGGPTFHTFGDGVERVVGVHSFTRTDDCLDGADTRVDAKAPFILQWLSEKEENCAPNFVCAVGTCLSPDPDCVELGFACEDPWQCRGRQCVSDPQRSQTYCSKACITDGDCQSGASCDVARQVCQLEQRPEARPGEPCLPQTTFCLSGSVCNGLKLDEALCSQSCTHHSECRTGQRCRTGFSGLNACMDAPPVTLPVGRLELPAAKGCSTGLGLMAALTLVWCWRRRPA